MYTMPGYSPTTAPALALPLSHTPSPAVAPPRPTEEGATCRENPKRAYAEPLLGVYAVPGDIAWRIRQHGLLWMVVTQLGHRMCTVTSTPPSAYFLSTPGCI